MRIQKPLRIIRAFISMSFMQQLAYPKSFFLAVAGKMLRAVILVIFFKAVFLHLSRIGTWSENDVLVLLAVYLSLESLIIITFHRNLAYYLPDHLRKGTFDGFLVKPLPVLPHVAFRIIDLMDIFSTVPVIALWAYILNRNIIAPDAMNLAIFMLALALAIIFSFSLSTIVAAISFWSLIPTGTGRLYEQAFRIGRYPVDALGTIQGFLLTYIIPFAIVGTVPASALRGTLNPTVLIPLTVVIGLFALLARFVWQRGLRRYSSASS